MSFASRGLGVALGLLAMAAAQAAPLPTTPGDRDLQRDRQEQLLREQQKRLDDLQQLPGQPSTRPSGLSRNRWTGS